MFQRGRKIIGICGVFCTVFFAITRIVLLYKSIVFTIKSSLVIIGFFIWSTFTFGRYRLFSNLQQRTI